MTVRVVLPAQLRILARCGSEVELCVDGRVTVRSLLDALESRYPMLRGTLRDHAGGERRAFVRFFACEEDFSNAMEDELPAAVAEGREPLLVVGAIAGGRRRPSSRDGSWR